MAQKALEGVVRELLKVVTDLATKVSALEVKIDEQTAIIVKQAQSLSLLTLTVEGTTKLVPPKLLDADGDQELPAVLATTQRPIRQARVNSSAKSKSGYAAAAKKPAAAKPGTDGDVGEQNNLPKTSTVTATSGNHNLPTKTNISSLECRATKLAETRTDDTRRDNHENDIADDGWQPARKARHSKRRVVTGSGQEDDELKTVEKLKYLQAWSFKPETTEQNVLTYLNKLQDCDQYLVEKRLIQTSRHAAFVIAFPESLNERINTPAAWPVGVKLSDWFPRRPRQQRGDTSSEISTGASAGAVVGRSS